MTGSTPLQLLDTLHTALQALRNGTLDPHGFSRQARAQQLLLDALPARYSEVLFNLLTRLESSALFSEESCSFSQSALVDNLQMWVDKARLQLA